LRHDAETPERPAPRRPLLRAWATGTRQKSQWMQARSVPRCCATRCVRVRTGTMSDACADPVDAPLVLWSMMTLT